MKIKIGDLVESINGDGLHSGSYMYDVAVVVNVNPLVMTSIHGDMMWTNIPPETLRCVGVASRDVFVVGKLALARSIGV